LSTKKTVVYVETSVISFYHEIRTELDMAARREWTRTWWNSASRRHDLVTSAAVIEELREGDYPSRDECLELVGALPLLAIEPAVMDIVEAYIARHVMPADPAGDALHLALASYHRCDFLVTWNRRHLANANKFGHIRRVNTLLGLYVPALVTPLELVEEGSDES
jgi:predicted nucleic acid-binding protein